MSQSDKFYTASIVMGRKLHKKLRLYCAEQEISASEYIRRLIRKDLGITEEEEEENESTD